MIFDEHFANNSNPNILETQRIKLLIRELFDWNQTQGNRNYQSKERKKPLGANENSKEKQPNCLKRRKTLTTCS